MFRLIRPIFGVLAIMAGTSTLAENKDAQTLATFGDWSVFVDRAEHVCWAATVPVASSENAQGQTYLMASVYTDLGPTPQISYFGNGPLLESVVIRMRVGSVKADMYSDNNVAWLPDAGEDARMLDAMRVSDEVALTGIAGDGRAVYERFSLEGFGPALADAVTRCEGLSSD